jgi:hypothetical protein
LTETLPSAGPAGSRKTPGRPCLNCGDDTPGNYCRNCGQRKIEVRVTLRRMLMEALDDQFSLNSALPRTVGALLFRPGRLTRDYMDGRIARYIPPFRLYLVSSVLFFLALSYNVRYGDTGIRVSSRDSAAVAAPAAPTAPALADSAAARAPADPATSAPADSSGDQWLKNVRVRTGMAEVDSLANTRIGELSRMQPKQAVERVSGAFLEYVPQTMFLLLPLFAGVLKLLYSRRKRLYVEHFVFALHLHAFVFLSFTLMMVVPDRVEVVAGLWIMLYTYLAMYRVYGQGWFWTGVKYVALGFTYFVLMTLALTVTLVLALALM